MSCYCTLCYRRLASSAKPVWFFNTGRRFLKTRFRRKYAREIERVFPATNAGDHAKRVKFCRRVIIIILKK